MPRVQSSNQFNVFDPLQSLITKLRSSLAAIEAQLNGLSEGRIYNKYNAVTAAPTTGLWAQGDFVWNSTPVEAGSASSKYVIIGWICTVSGEPGTFLECRALTGN